MNTTTPSPEGTRRINLVWIALMVLTVLSWVLASIHDPARFGPSTPVTVAVVIIAGIKATGIILEFMEVRLDPLKLRAITGLWIVAVMSLIIAFYLD